MIILEKDGPGSQGGDEMGTGTITTKLDKLIFWLDRMGLRETCVIIQYSRGDDINSKYYTRMDRFDDYLNGRW